MTSLRTYVATMAVLVLCSSVVSANDAVIAQRIAGKLRAQQQASQLQGFRIRVNVEDGNVWLKGEVANDAQRQLAINLARRVPGVNVVVNELSLEPVGPASSQRPDRALPPVIAGTEAPWARPVQPAAAMSAAPAPQAYVPTARPIARQASAAAPLIPRPVSTSRMPQRVASLPGHVISDQAVSGSGGVGGGCYGGGDCYGENGGGQTYGGSGSYGAGGYDSGGTYGGSYGGDSGGGAYAGQYGGGTAGNYDSPNMPGYAWPSYASHPNYAALTYPQQYSPTAWPYIGPFYPYPQVPLGWRKVALEWDDGWWFLDFSSK